MLEPDARKRARPVLRGPERRKVVGLPGECASINRLLITQSKRFGASPMILRDRHMVRNLAGVLAPQNLRIMDPDCHAHRRWKYAEFDSRQFDGECVRILI